jgi:hypothetical protein
MASLRYRVAEDGGHMIDMPSAVRGLQGATPSIS